MQSVYQKESVCERAEMHIFFDERLLGSLVLHVVIPLQKFIILSPRNKGNFLELPPVVLPASAILLHLNRNVGNIFILYKRLQIQQAPCIRFLLLQ